MAPAARNPVVLAGALLLSLAAQGARAEFPAFPFSSIPACVTACVERAGCDAVDLPCMCDRSSGSFLPDVAACIRAGCDASLSVDALIEPLVNTCGTLDAPVPSAAVSSAREVATGTATGTGAGATQTPGEPSAVPKPPPRTTDTTMTTATGAATKTPATAPETTGATTTDGETTPTGTAAPTSPAESSPSSAPPESAAPLGRASLLGASMGILLVLAVGW